jgi:hypothetical protein
MQAWSTFFAVISGAAATMTGLLFVAMSMNAAVALSRGPRGSRRLTEQAFENYLAVLMVSLLALIPGMSLPTFGRTALAVTASWTLWVLVRFYQAAAEPSVHESRLSAIRHHLSTLIGFGMLVYSAGRMAFGGPDMHDIVASAMIVLLFSATAKAWGLLDRIATAARAD